MQEIKRINITIPKKLLRMSRVLIKEGLYSNFSELVRESIKNELLLDQSLITKKKILNRWFSEEMGKEFEVSNLSKDK
jgi:Arc/MetJ-type ribon-helix-helix transcriptional regulator